MKWLLLSLVVLLGLVAGGWMTFDAARRLWVGDYVRIAGQLGPWQYLFKGLGVDPLGPPVAVLFLVCGLARVAASVGLVLRASWAWDAALLSAIAGIWYLPVGTLFSLISIAILFAPLIRAHFAG